MIIFISNFVSPHTIPLSEYLYEKLGERFLFIETMKMTSERQSLGYSHLQSQPFVVCFEKYNSNRENYLKLIDSADTVIASYGSIDASLLSNRISKNKLTFLMSERLFKKGILKLADPKFWKALYFINSVKQKNVHLLCMGAYVSRDFGMCGFPKGKMWKFGYITNARVDTPICKKRQPTTVRLMWVGRMIWWKKPFVIIKAAEILKKKGVDFHLDVVGGGKLAGKFEACQQKSIAADSITYHGLKKGDDVQKMMNDADILLCTSNRLEGWGAVINEGMMNRCVVIANKSMGAAPYLIDDGVNGFLYSGGAKELADTIEKAIASDMSDISEKAYHNIVNNWSPEVAANKLLGLIINIEGDNKSKQPLFEKGICSLA